MPPVSALLTSRLISLHAIPFALDFLTVVVVASLGGLIPALLAILVSIVSRWFFYLHHPALLAPYDPIRVGVILTAALLVSWISRRNSHSEKRLAATLDALQERTDDLIASLASSRCACWTLDLDSGKSARWYSGSYPVFGRPFQELELLPSLRPLLHPDDQPRLLELVEHMRTSWEPTHFEHRVPWPNGELHWLEMRGNRVPGKPCVWRGVTVDVTERKLAEAALLRAEKLAAMGRLASTVAHEINNPLEAVTNLLYLSTSDTSLNPATRAYLKSAESELARLGNITRLTLGFVRNSGGATVTDIATVMEEVISIFRHRLETKNVRIERRYGADIRIHIVPHELRQIVTNLIANAADAVASEGSYLGVETTFEDDRAILYVEDNGSGIAEANLSRIFEPFFSTKGEIGTGIGLWVTRELVEKNGGRIFVESGNLPGDLATRFRLEFPLAKPHVS